MPEFRAALNPSFQVAGSLRQFGTRRHRGKEGVGGCLEEDQEPGGSSSSGGSDDHERAQKRQVALADTELQEAVKKKSQCEEEIAEAEADLARMREEHSASGESAAVAGESCSVGGDPEPPCARFRRSCREP